MKFHLFFTLAVYFVAFTETEAQVGIAKRLNECSTNAQKTFDACLSQLLEDVRPFLKNGIPELNIPKLEPIHWDNLRFTQRNGSIDFTAEFSNVLVHGFSNYTLKSLRVNTKKSELQVRVFIPILEIIGNYILDGKLLRFKIHGNGTFISAIHDIDAGLVSKIVIKKEAGKERLGVENTRINFRISRANTELDNLFNGDEVLGEIANHFLNNNDQMIFKELKPFLAESLQDLIGALMDGALATLPISALPTILK